MAKQKKNVSIPKTESEWKIKVFDNFHEICVLIYLRLDVESIYRQKMLGEKPCRNLLTCRRETATAAATEKGDK